MSHGHTDAELIARTHNTARFFTESRQLAWVVLAATIVSGIFSYSRMPQRKDPDIPVRQALVMVPWPGASAEKIEQLITRRVEEKVAENVRVEKIESNTRTGVATVVITLVQGLADTGKEFDDINLKLDTIRDLPDGAGPIVFVKDFGDTAALMLTVASPRADAAEIAARADGLERAIVRARAGSAPGPRVTLAYGLPTTVSPDQPRRHVDLFVQSAVTDAMVADPRVIEGAGFIALDVATSRTEAELAAYAARFLRDRLRLSEFHPDVWPGIIVRDPADARTRLSENPGHKYSYKELDDFTDLIARTFKGLEIVSKVTRTGLVDERVFLEYSQERLASYGVSPLALRQALADRNVTMPRGMLEMDAKNVALDVSGEFTSERELGDVLIPTASGARVPLRDLADVSRGYVSPPTFLNFHGGPDGDGSWQRRRAVTLAVQMRAGSQIAEFERAMDRALENVSALLPADLIFARTSDQPRQVRENVDLFMSSLYEAIALVVLVSLIGFWEWRSALLMALSIPITLCMTFAMVYPLGIDLQQISIASLIIALGLLVDDPVVAGDAIKRHLAAGHPPLVAAWLGPTKLATAILYATLTNIVAYVPFLFLPGDTGAFLYSMPVVIGCSLVASRLVSMTFIPLLGYYLLKPKAEPTIEERRRGGFAALYYRVGRSAIRHRWAFLAASLVVLAGGALVGRALPSSFFPKDLQYLSYVDVWLPEDAPLSATAAAGEQVEAIVRRVAGAKLKSLTTFVGGGGPRFWFAVAPEQSQLNYAQILIEVYDKHDTRDLIAPLQAALDAEVPGARVDVLQLEVGPPVGTPVAVRIAGEDIATLRALAAEAARILRDVPIATRVRDNWGPESFSVRLDTDPERANLSGLTHADVAYTSIAAMNGTALTTLREGATRIPIVARLRMEERASLSDIRSMYVYAASGPEKLPLEAVSSMAYGLQSEKLQRRNQFRTVTVSAFPTGDHLPSDVLAAALPRIDALKRSLPPGYTLEIGGEHEEQVKGFGHMAVVMAISVILIFLALVFQFRHAVKPFIVFAAIPYGICGALATLWIAGAPFGFMAFLGVASLIGVIVSHIIVLFDFIEEMREQGKPLEESLLDAGIMRLRPVLITVAATVIALFPLAAHGGPLWEPMCFAQIGGLTAATVVTLLVVPVLYATFVLDLKIVAWDSNPQGHRDTEAQS
jgi:multidrug efflux pump subunit AcrB